MSPSRGEHEVVPPPEGEEEVREAGCTWLWRASPACCAAVKSRSEERRLGEGAALAVWIKLCMCRVGESLGVSEVLLGASASASPNPNPSSSSTLDSAVTRRICVGLQALVRQSGSSDTQQTARGCPEPTTQDKLPVAPASLSPNLAMRRPGTRVAPTLHRRFVPCCSPRSLRRAGV